MRFNLPSQHQPGFGLTSSNLITPCSSARKSNVHSHDILIAQITSWNYQLFVVLNLDPILREGNLFYSSKQNPVAI